MGNKIEKDGKDHKIPQKELKDLSVLTGLSKDYIKNLFDQFYLNNEDGKLNKDEFIALYSKLRLEPNEKLSL